MKLAMLFSLLCAGCPVREQSTPPLDPKVIEACGKVCGEKGGPPCDCRGF